MKKYRPTKASRKDKNIEPNIDLNACSAGDFTGLIPFAPQTQSEQDSYEEIYPTGFEDKRNT